MAQGSSSAYRHVADLLCLATALRAAKLGAPTDAQLQQREVHAWGTPLFALQGLVARAALGGAPLRSLDLRELQVLCCPPASTLEHSYTCVVRRGWASPSESLPTPKLQSAADSCAECCIGSC